MTWFVPSDLESRLSPKALRELSTGLGQAADPDEAVLQEALDRAEAEVRGVLAGRTTLPDDLPAGLLRDVALDLAVEGLFLRKPGEAATVPEGWQGRLKRSRSLLDQMAQGEIPIPSTTARRRLEVINPPSPVDGAFR